MSAARRHPRAGGAEDLHVVAPGPGRVDRPRTRRVERAGQAHPGDAERPEQPVLDDRLVGAAGDVLDEQAEQAVVEVGVRVRRAGRALSAARQPELGDRRARVDASRRRTSLWYDGKPAVCDSSWRTVIADTPRSTGVAPTTASEALADGLVERRAGRPRRAAARRRRDHLGDAGDAEAVAELDRLRRFGGTARRSSRGHVRGGRRLARDGRRRRGRRRGAAAAAPGSRRRPVCTISPSTATATDAA